MYHLSQTDSIEKMIFEFGITDGFIMLMKFYKYNISIMTSYSDCQIMTYIYSQSISSIYADMSLAILRDSIGFISFQNLIKMCYFFKTR